MEQTIKHDPIPVIPTPSVDNLRKADTDDIVTELISLRTYCGLLMLRLKDFVEGNQLEANMQERVSHMEAIGEFSRSTLTEMRSYVQGIPEQVTTLEHRLDRVQDFIERLTALERRVEALSTAHEIQYDRFVGRLAELEKRV